MSGLALWMLVSPRSYWYPSTSVFPMLRFVRFFVDIGYLNGLLAGWALMVAYLVGNRHGFDASG